ncbi:DEAD-domain-containing protein [Xylariaceae sp. FL0016]|nr:DEAD-domain-containing protein [Xylariaceae sp. FL0016]
MEDPSATRGRRGPRGPRRGGRGGRRRNPDSAFSNNTSQQNINESRRDGGRIAVPSDAQAISPVAAPTSGSHAPLTISIPSDTPKFSELAEENLIHSTLLQTIAEDMGFNHMTPVQAATLRPLLRDQSDVLAQAKTGTGKTVAFLLPAIQHLINRDPAHRGYVSLLVISPTRELALQIADEAKALLQRLPQFKVCTAIGGTNKDTEERRILNACDILIGTPGRLYDHLTTSGRDVAETLQKLNTLVLDEADRLLDMGFLDSLKKIIACLPNKAVSKRQGMLFSATVPEHVQKVAHLALAKDYKFISTVPKGEINTHQRVAQQLVIVPNFSDLAAALVGALRHEQNASSPGPFKAIVFAPTAGLVDFYRDVWEALTRAPDNKSMPIVALHARMTQSRRLKVTEQFRECASGILFATDVVARGMDFPGVTNVVQVGLPFDKESYIHRLGRTARAGAEGSGTLILTSHETFFSQMVLKEIALIETAPDLLAHGDVVRAAEKMDGGKVYKGWLGYYKGHAKKLGWDAETLVKQGNRFALEGLGTPEVPPLAKSTVGKMGLKGTRGLVVVPDPPRAPRGGGGRGRGAPAR